MAYFFLTTWLAICALQDARQKRIANSLVLGCAVVALACFFITDRSLLGATAGQVILACCLALLLTIPGYAMGQLGAGDVKMLAALALASDAQHVLLTLVGAALALASWAAFGAHCGKKPLAFIARHLGYLTPNPRRDYPYAPFALCGFLLAMAWGKSF